MKKAIVKERVAGVITRTYAIECEDDVDPLRYMDTDEAELIAVVTEDAKGASPSRWVESEIPVQTPAIAAVLNTPDVSKCMDCGAVRDTSNLDEITRYSERVTPGSPAPSGQCPGCGGLAYRD